MRIVLTYNLKKDANFYNLPQDYFSEFDSQKTVDAIVKALEDKGHEVFPVEAGKNLTYWLKKNKVDIAFNIAEGDSGENRESQIPAILESFCIPYTGSSAFTLAIALDKARTKQILRYEGIPTPDFQLFKNGENRLRRNLRFPLIVKPNREGSAKGITIDSIVYDEERAHQQIHFIQKRYNQEVLVEEFIEGKELTVGVLGTSQPMALPILEIDFSQCQGSGEHFYSWRMKEFQGDASLGLNPAFYCPARLNEGLMEDIMEVAKKTHMALGCRDFSRTDIRLSADGIPYCLEVNPLPGLDPDGSNLTYITKSAGIEYVDLINGILESALRRRTKEGDELKWERMVKDIVTVL